MECYAEIMNHLVSKTKMETIINAAINKLFTYDYQLITNRMEWATAHRLAVYLEGIFPDFSIDCEYNKMGPDYDPKHDSNNNHKRPDIIIHKRGDIHIESNLLIIELKMNNGEDEDESKLLDFTDTPRGNRKFQYQLGLKISFLPNLEFKWFKEGFKFKETTQENYFTQRLINLATDFDQEMVRIYLTAKKEVKYNAARFFQMLQNHRGVNTAKILINYHNVSEGYVALYERGRLDLTVEAMIYNNQKWHPLFNENEIQICKQRLRDYNYLK